MTVTMEKLVALAKHRGFIFPGSDLYGGLANSWDFGPLGVELKQNLKRLYWQRFVQESDAVVGLDSAILMNREVWVASGHVGNFSDPLTDCRVCKTRHRADKLLEAAWLAEGSERSADGLDFSALDTAIKASGVRCPDCGARDFTPVRQFNMMFRTHLGVTDEASAEVFLRPETAQGIFINFKHVMRSMRLRLPFGIAQIGKSFRNEITPGNFIFRTREFEQMELEFFFRPGDEDRWFGHWREFCFAFARDLGLREQNLRLRDHSPEQLSHYSKATTDIEYLYPFGWGELLGVANRTDFDLRRHMAHSRVDLTVVEEGGEPFLPHCIEPAMGVDRMVLALYADAYEEQELGDGDLRTVLHFHPALAPFKAAILPLSKKLNDDAHVLYTGLRQEFRVDYDDSGSIGKRYRRHDEIGTPFCITVDFQTAEDGCVTVRDRDTMEQVRIAIADVSAWLRERTAFAPHLPSAQR